MTFKIPFGWKHRERMRLVMRVLTPYDEDRISWIIKLLPQEFDRDVQEFREKMGKAQLAGELLGMTIFKMSPTITTAGVVDQIRLRHQRPVNIVELLLLNDFKGLLNGRRVLSLRRKYVKRGIGEHPGFWGLVFRGDSVDFSRFTPDLVWRRNICYAMTSR